MFICTWQRRTCYIFPEMCLWCDTCWPLVSHAGCQANLLQPLDAVIGGNNPRAPKFFRFHVVFGKIWQNRMLAPAPPPPPPGVGAPSLWEILDPPLFRATPARRQIWYIKLCSCHASALLPWRCSEPIWILTLMLMLMLIPNQNVARLLKFGGERVFYWI